ncbi:MAG: tetratricopeptide repeat protein [Pirellulaceae bacterium]|nr:tetratricopeptide repeat protein [Pirellulaceae bacterium]
MWIAKRYIFILAVCIFSLGQFPALVTSEQENHLIVQQNSKQESTANLPLQSPKDDSLELEPLYTDDFSTDSRADYKIGGPEGAVLWEVGKLSIGEKGSLRRELDTGGWIELEADLTFEELTDANPQAELRVVVEIEDSTPCYLQLQQRLRDGKVQSKLAVFDTPGPDSGRFLPEKIDELAMDGPLPSGRWRIGYRYGFWTVQSPDTYSSLFVLVENGVNRVKEFRVESVRARIQLNRIGVQGCDWLPAPLTKGQKAELAIAAQRNNQAFELFQAGKRLEALPLLEEALAIQSKVLGKEHPDYANSLNNLAILQHYMGRYELALPLFEESLDITHKFLGKEHPEYATGLNNLALLHQKMGAHEQALPLLEESLAIKAKVLGKEHPDYATSLSSLAAFHHGMRAYERALPLHEESLAIIAKVLGKEHPEYANTLHHLAALHRDLRAYELALPLFEEALAITAKVLGKEHPEYVNILDNLARVHQKLGAYVQAMSMFEESIAVRAKAGPRP